MSVPIVGKTFTPFVSFKKLVGNPFNEKKLPQAEDTVQLSRQGQQKKDSLIRRVLQRMGFLSKSATTEPGNTLAVSAESPTVSMATPRTVPAKQEPLPTPRRKSVFAIPRKFPASPLKTPAKHQPTLDDLKKV